MRRPTLEWSVVLWLAMPIYALSIACSSLWVHSQAQDWSSARQLQLAADVAAHFSDAGSWSNEARLKLGLLEIEHRSAWLEDEDRARIWHQGPGLEKSSWRQLIKGPDGPILRWPLRPGLSLVIQSQSMQESEREHWLRQCLFAFGLALLGPLPLCALGHHFIVRRWRKLRNWSRELEKGQLDSAFSGPGISGEVAEYVSILARRLWYSRQTLNHFQQDIDVRQRDQIRQLQSQVEKLHAEKQSIRDEDQSRSALFSGINHELRTPLTGIIGFTELLENTPLSAEQLDYVKTIRKSSSDMVGLISDFLDHQRADAGQLVIHQGKLDPAHIIEDCIALLAPMAYEKDLQLVSIIDHDVPESVTGDAARLRQILTNLMSNAIKFTAHGHVLIRLQRESESDDAIHLILQIEDTGRGLSTEEQEKLFGVFQRFESDDKPAIGGSGLGLSIVQQLTDLLGGSIEVESEPGRGSTFSVKLPFGRLPNPRSTPAWDALRGRSIHLFEANEISRRGLQHQLTFWGLNYEIANSLENLRNNIGSHSKATAMDLVLLGVDAKRLDESTLSSVCQHAHNNNLRVLCVVDSVDSATHERLRCMGFDQVLAKSTPRSSLYRSLAECLQQDQAQAPLHDTDVLIVENNSASQRYLQSMLKNAGARVFVASDGDETLQRWQQEQPRFVLLDFNLGHTRGDEITKRIRETDPSGNTVIIGMSAHLTPAEERQWYEAGLDSLLIKPFDQAQFLRCIHPWLDSALQTSTKPSESSGAKLVNDPELAALIVEELPLQLQELDNAFVQGEWEAARAAAHQLHGTAAFFHLEPLKSHVFLLETRLNKDDSPGDNLQLRDDVINVTQDVSKILRDLRTDND